MRQCRDEQPILPRCGFLSRSESLPPRSRRRRGWQPIGSDRAPATQWSASHPRPLVSRVQSPSLDSLESDSGSFRRPKSNLAEVESSVSHGLFFNAPEGRTVILKNPCFRSKSSEIISAPPTVDFPHVPAFNAHIGGTNAPKRRSSSRGRGRNSVQRFS